MSALAAGALTVAHQEQASTSPALSSSGPDYLIFNRPMSVIDQRIQDQILRNILQARGRSTMGDKPAIIWVLSNPALSQLFDRVVVFDRGTRRRTEPTTRWSQRAASLRGFSVIFEQWGSGMRTDGYVAQG